MKKEHELALNCTEMSWVQRETKWQAVLCGMETNWQTGQDREKMQKDCNIMHMWLLCRGVDPGEVGSCPPPQKKICRRDKSMFWPLKMSHSFTQNCCWITHIIKGERLVSKIEAPETVWWLDLTDPEPHILCQIYTTAAAKITTDYRPCHKHDSGVAAWWM